MVGILLADEEKSALTGSAGTGKAADISAMATPLEEVPRASEKQIYRKKLLNTLFNLI